MKALAIATAMFLGGCQLILGLDETSVGGSPDAPAIDAKIDAPPEIDAPPACSTPPECPVTTGRSLCGQIYGTGDEAGPLRANTPTGQSCALAGGTAGPCAFTIRAGTVEQFDGDSFETVAVAATIDDCGRFQIPDLETTGLDVVVVATAPDHIQTNTLYTDRDASLGADKDGRALSVTMATSTAWAEQLVPGIGKNIEGGFLFTFLRNNAPRTGVRAAIDSMNPPNRAFFDTTGPWAAYFGAVPFGALDPANKDDLTTDPVTPAAGSEASGTAYGAFTTVSGTADGFRTGVRCTAPLHLTHAPTGFFVVTIDGC